VEKHHFLFYVITFSVYTCIYKSRRFKCAGVKRYSILEQLLPIDNDYEYLLQKSFEIYKIQRMITDVLFLKIRSNKHIARQGIMLDPRFTPFLI
jgi:hypothetical protein